MDESKVCRFCRIIIGAGNPHKVEYGGRTAHESCVRRAEVFSALNAALAALYLRIGCTALLKPFRAEADRTNRLPRYAKLLSWSLTKAYDLSSNGKSGQRQDVVDFARKASEVLYCEVTIAQLRISTAAVLEKQPVGGAPAGTSSRMRKRGPVSMRSS